MHPRILPQASSIFRGDWQVHGILGVGGMARLAGRALHFGLGCFAGVPGLIKLNLDSGIFPQIWGGPPLGGSTGTHGSRCSGGGKSSSSNSLDVHPVATRVATGRVDGKLE